MTHKALPMLLVFLGLTALAALPGALLRPGAWFALLQRPAWQPPDWVFGPVWGVLYVTIALAAWLVWRKAGFAGAALPLAVWGLQLLLNAAWTALFFGLQRIDLAFYEILLLWAAIVATLVLFYPLRRVAALLLLPYLAWVSFAAVLTHAVWTLNPTA